ncbi:uncharacterized protein EV154DRAFT_511030 [Mucor mucedo]|uniref:uncharacterized protein n=1 Tax=Mucor mucedo TaxID=29922 RepID=UPI00221FDA55|nr:uncharacterized protein EV154DRAFT_511030 [Mucor mucedo]KAI7890624.1 hypothetical protein EV154DRAFT_511030 [Mucor mucedo]
MATVKPIIRLPPRSKSCTTRSVYVDDNSHDQQQQLVTEDLYFEDDENRLSDYDIERLLQEYNLYNIKRERGGGYLSFPDSKIADRVYSLFNGYIFTNGTILKFRLSPYQEPQAEGPILEVRNLPNHIDHNTLYDIFRPYGPLSICKPITEDGSHRGKALVQFFHRYHSDSSVSDLNNKTFDGNTIQITVLMVNNATRYPVNLNQSLSTPTTMVTSAAAEKENSFVDYMNLYVKNLDPTIDNTDLFNIFRKFGRIVSARVMSNPQNGLSKGYGFVSFGKPEEAALALEEMNGFQFRSKPMIVAYHEPKKPRQEKSTSTTTSSFHSPIDYANNTSTSPYFETRHPHEGPLNGLGIDHVDHLSMNVKELSVGNTNVPMQRKLSTIALVENSFSPPPIRTSPQFAARPSLASLASGASIQPAPPNSYEKTEQEKIVEEPSRSLRRRGSLESVNSVMTESSAHIQRQRMTEAVKRCGSYGKELHDIVDMLLTLKKKERSICLFNPDFLLDKINAALEALEICEDEEEEEEPVFVSEKKREKIELKHRAYIPVSTSPLLPLRKKSISPPATTVQETVVIPPRKSKAIPIVAPPAESIKTAEIKAMLSSFDGKAIHEKKQLLGDQLFPLVKATGVRHAPKITIRLLDSIELEELAKIMFDKDLLKVQVDKAFAGL